MTFRTNYWGTALFGSFGLLINFDSIKDINALFNASSSELEQSFQDVPWNLISEGESYFGNVMLDSLTNAVNTVITIKNIVLSSNWIGRLITIMKYILSRSVFYQYGTDVEIGLWWSNYNLLNYSVY